jgi:hypothetical protein
MSALAPSASPAPISPAATQPITALPSTDSLRQSVLTAVAKGMPLVVMTTLKGCPFCDVVRGHYLGPMLRDGEIQAIQLDMTDRRSALQGFDGRTTTPQAQIKGWHATMAPTVLFLGPGGEELAERLVGIAVQDMYGDYLKARLDEATARLRARKR